MKLLFALLFLYSTSSFGKPSLKIESGTTPKPFKLIGFAKVSPDDPKTVELKTWTGTYFLERKGLLNLNKQYLRGFKPDAQVILTVQGDLIRNYKIEPHPELAKR